MGKKLPVILISLVLFFALAVSLEFLSKQGENLHKYGKKITDYLEQQEAEVQLLLQDSAFIHAVLTNQPTNTIQISIENTLDKDFSILIFDQQELIFWNKTETHFSPSLFKVPPPSTQFQITSNGSYAVYQHEIKNFPNHLAISAIPLKRHYPVESPYLESSIPFSKGIPANINFTAQTTPYPVLLPNGQPLCFIEDSTSIDIQKHQPLLFILYLLGFICLCVLINHFANHLVRRYHPMTGALFLFGAVGGLRVLTDFSLLRNKFADLHFVGQTLSTPLYNSTLGDLLINSCILLWGVTFFHRSFRTRKSIDFSAARKMILSCLNYFSTFLGLIWVIQLVKIIVLDSGIVFDFNNIFNQPLPSFLTILCIILILVSLFIFSHRMMLATIGIGLSLHNRLAALALALLLSIPILFFAGPGLPVLYLLLIGIVYLSLFDLFVESQTPGLTWLIVWIFLLAAFMTGLLFKFNHDKEQQTKINYATSLADSRDSLAENHLIEWIDHLQHQSFMIDTSNLATLANQLEESFNLQKYLFNNYTFDLFLSSTDSTYLTTGRFSTFLPHSAWAQADTSQNQQLRFTQKSTHPYTYLIQVALDTANQVHIGIRHKRRQASKLYDGLFATSNYKGLQHLGAYDYALFQDQHLLQSKGPPPLELHQRAEQLMPGSWAEYRQNSHTYILYRDKSGSTTVIVGENLDDSTKPLSLFSYLFAIFLVLIGFLLLLNIFIKAIPKTFEFPFMGQPSLRNKIQLAVLALIMGSFFIIGLVTVAFFQSSSVDYHEDRLRRKISAVVQDVEHEFNLLSPTGATAAKLRQMVQPVSEIHDTDVHLFDLNGQLISTSAPFIFEQGIVAPRLNPEIRRILKPEQEGHYVTEEKIGSFHFQVAYVNVHAPDGKAVAYLGLPYYSSKRNLNKDVYDYIGTLLNVYVFLLLGAGAIAIAVANSITQPISKIGEKLSLFKLGKNEPLEWKSQDEIGQLINEYNQMIKKLEESTEKLKVSEREGAWREMAKQVAHEIKNPLTPMKLSIQYLMHAQKSNSDNLAPLLKRVSQTLIEQIEGLSRIASEFSNFAKMPKARNEVFIVNELVQSVHNLYMEEVSQNGYLRLALPEKDYAVYADKGHMSRVLTNLIKNALQAIPDGRTPDIKVKLYEADQKAVICVSDNGTGISEEMQDKVFYPNFTTKTSGMGLGLAISKSIIESINGKIYFKTQIDKGTDFFIELPLVEPSSPEQQ